jgi:hypothetical protein
MSTSIRQQILDKVGDRLKTINGMNGYKTNFRENVYEYAPQGVDAEAIPCIVYRDALCDTSNYNTNNTVPIDIHQHRMIIEVEAKLSGDAAMPDARQSIADIWKAVGVESGGAAPGNWGGFALRTDPIGDAIATNIQDQQYVSIIVKFLIIFRTAAWDAYTVR